MESNTKMAKIFVCDICNKSYTSKQILQRHMERFHLNRDNPNATECIVCDKFILDETLKDHYIKYHKALKCEKCPKEYYNRHAYLMHKKTHEEEFICDHCSKSFSTKPYLHQHIKHIHLGNRDLSKCDGCGKMIYTQNLQQHIRLVHEKKFNRKCEICGNFFRKTKVLKNHIIQEHLQHKNGVCVICKEHFKLKRDLTAHLKDVHEIKSHNEREPVQKIFVCDYCKKSFTFKRNLKHHMDRFHLNRDNPNAEECLVCRNFILKENLKDHFKKYHKTLKCDQCPNEYYNERLFYHHKRSHEGFTCDHCSRIFSSKPYLLKHVHETHFGKNGLSKCKECGKMITTLNMRRHIKEVHDKKFDHKCDICGKLFATPKELKDHIALDHLQLKNYVCSICDKNFKSKNSLTIHLNSVHGAKPKTKCEKCGKSFTRADYLKKHLKSHQNRPFFCPYHSCKSMFKADKELQKHISATHTNPAKHRLIKHKCDKCEKTYTTPLGLQIHKTNEHLGLKYECHHCEKKFTLKHAVKHHLLASHF